ncbi:MAG: DUF6020 family protein [Roseburia sp.]|nr:DUF6020 family protein [Roseburia sp.]
MRHERDLLKKKIGYLLFSVVGMLFVFCFITGSELERRGNIEWSSSHTAMILLISFLIGSLLGSMICFVVYRLPGWSELSAGAVHKASFLGDGGTFLLCLVLIFLAWLPYFLAYYPGICAYDAVTQIGQIETGEYVEHHPLAHTLWIRACLWLGGSLFGDANRGGALYTLLQMLLLAAAMAYGILVLKRNAIKPGWQLLFLLFSMFYPFHGYLSVSMTKDVIFTAFFLFQVLSLFELLRIGRNDFSLHKADILFLVSSLGMILFRNNGQYAMLVLTVSLPVSLLLGRGKRKRERKALLARLFLECIGALLAGNVALWALSASVNAVQGDKREMLSMPIQQLARCMLYHGGQGVYPEDDDTMAREDKELIQELFMGDGYLGYMPHISDPVKSRTLTSVIRYQPGRFATSYLRLMTSYFGDFVNAALEVNAGYLYLNDRSHSTIYQEMYPGMEGKGYVQTQWWESVVEKTGIHKASKWPALHEKLESWADKNMYLKVPVIKYLFVPGIWLWWCLILLCALLVWRKYAFCLPLFLILGYFATLLLGPVVQLRYIYPVMVSVPYLTVLCFRQEAVREWERKESEEQKGKRK